MNEAPASVRPVIIGVGALAPSGLGRCGMGATWQSLPLCSPLVRWVIRSPLSCWDGTEISNGADSAFGW